MHIPERVTVTEVGPRDGLQSFPRPVSTDDKIRIIERLVEAGFASIEVTSFSRPDVVPHLADAEQVAARLPRCSRVDYRALVPNRRGAERAVAAGLDTLVALLTVTESYSRKNQNRTVAELVEGVIGILEYGADVGIHVDVVVGTAFFDPYEGDTPEERVEAVFERLVEAGAQRLAVATSVGMANPAQVHHLCRRLLDRWPQLKLAVHLHDTNGMALANALAAMDAGVQRFESAICGIGGGMAMPEGMTEVGNVASEDLVHMLAEMGVHTGVDPMAAVACARQVADILGIETSSRAARGGTKWDVLDGARRDRIR